MANLTDTLRLRNHQFATGRCEYCRYWRSGFCQVLELVVDEAQVCDAFQADENVYKQNAFWGVGDQVIGKLIHDKARERGIGFELDVDGFESRTDSSLEG